MSICRVRIHNITLHKRIPKSDDLEAIIFYLKISRWWAVRNRISLVLHLEMSWLLDRLDGLGWHVNMLRSDK
jgi:hypothetical protein